MWGREEKLAIEIEGMGLNTGSLTSVARRQGINIHCIGGLNSVSRETECLNGEM